MPERVLYGPLGEDFARAMRLLDGGVYSLLADGGVESYGNLGCVHVGEEELDFCLYTYSLGADAEAELRERLYLLSELCGCSMWPDSYAPVWEPAAEKWLAALCKAAYALTTDAQMQAHTAHHSLECGYFMQKNPQLQCVALGPGIEGEHSAEEALVLETLPAHVETLCRVLDAIADE